MLAGEIVEGLVLDTSGQDGSVSAGRGYDGRGRHVSRAAATNALLTAVPRPGTGLTRWAAVVLRYGRTAHGDVYDRDNVRHDRYQDDFAAVAHVVGEPAATIEDAVRPDVGDDLLIADIEIPASGPWGSADTTRRTPTTRDVGAIDRALRALEATPFLRAELPGPPDNLAAAISDDGRTVNLSWWWPARPGSAQVTTFRVTEMVNGGIETVIEDNVRGLELSRTLDLGSTACFRVYARSAAGLSNEWAEAGVGLPSSDPRTPPSFTATQEDRMSSRVQLAWKAPATAPASYRLERALGGGGYQEYRDGITDTEATYGAGTETMVRFRLFAVFGDGTESPPAEVVTTLLPLGPDPYPDNEGIGALIATSTASAGQRTVTFAWPAYVGLPANASVSATVGLWVRAGTGLSPGGTQHTESATLSGLVQTWKSSPFTDASPGYVVANVSGRNRVTVTVTVSGHRRNAGYANITGGHEPRW